jgi:hypothetical protein
MTATANSFTTINKPPAIMGGYDVFNGTGVGNAVHHTNFIPSKILFSCSPKQATQAVMILSTSQEPSMVYSYSATFAVWNYPRAIDNSQYANFILAPYFKIQLYLVSSAYPVTVFWDAAPWTP